MAKIYRQQRHSRDDDDSGSDDEDAGLCGFFKEENGKVTLILNLMFRIVIFVVIFICLSFPQEKNDT